MSEKYQFIEIINPREQDLKEKEEEGFTCANCGAWVPFNLEMGTQNRNHCPKCLFSQHLDLNISGDRKADCGGKMEPVGLTFKQEGVNKWGKLKQGELMLVHKCVKCGKIAINRIAGDDYAEAILNVFYKGNDAKSELQKQGINPLGKEDEQGVKTQLYGKNG